MARTQEDTASHGAKPRAPGVAQMVTSGPQLDTGSSCKPKSRGGEAARYLPQSQLWESTTHGAEGEGRLGGSAD